MRDLASSLNLLAGTSGLDAQAAANAWAGTTGLGLLGALNAKAGTVGLELNGVCRVLAGQEGGDPSLDAPGALSTIVGVQTYEPYPPWGLDPFLAEFDLLLRAGGLV